MGATHVGRAQRRILALAREMGVGIVPTYLEGKNVLYFNGRRNTYTGFIPPVSPAALAEAAVLIPRVNQMAREVPLDAPYRAGRADEWDGKSVETWKLENTRHEDTRTLLDLAVQAFGGVEPREVSFLQLLFVVRAAGSIEQLITTEGGALEFHLEGGTQLVANELAKRIGRTRVLLGGRVRSITQRGGGVELETRKAVVRARRAIVAVPPTLVPRIAFKPRLPALHDQLFQHLPMGSIIKTIAVYDRPFWRDKGLTGQATSEAGPVKVTFDASPEAGRPGILMGFVPGAESRILTPKSPEQRAREALQSYATYFGEEALRPRQYFDRTWDTDLFARGLFGVMPPGTLTGFGGALREPFDRIHWAGTETATEWYGFMEGAIESGERAAREVLAEL
jgi:monoamine oxidase